MEFERLSEQYHGAVAEDYDRRREQTPRWLREQAAVEKLLDGIERQYTVLDIPVGTGRFVELYEQIGFSAIGLDVSEDMLSHARSKAEQSRSSIKLQLGDIRNIPFPDATFGISVCIRFLNWVDIRAANEVMNELARVSKRYVVVSITHFVPVRSLLTGPSAGFRSIAGQAARRFKTQLLRNASKRRIIYHEQNQVKELFDNTGLRIAESICTEPGRRGVTSYIYLLEKHT